MAIVVWQYNARTVPRLADQHAAIYRDLAHQLWLGLLIFGADERRRLFRVFIVDEGEAAAPEASAAEPCAKDAGGLQEDLM
jgi:hypothetical protein